MKSSWNVNRNWISVRKCIIFDVRHRINGILVQMKMYLNTIRFVIVVATAGCWLFQLLLRIVESGKLIKPLYNWRQMPFEIMYEWACVCVYVCARFSWMFVLFAERLRTVICIDASNVILQSFLYWIKRLFIALNIYLLKHWLTEIERVWRIDVNCDLILFQIFHLFL